MLRVFDISRAPFLLELYKSSNIQQVDSGVKWDWNLETYNVSASQHNSASGTRVEDINHFVE